MIADSIIGALLDSDDAVVRFNLTKKVLDRDPDPEMVRMSPRAGALLSERTADGEIPYHPYAKWYGAHWVLVTLAEMGYPPGDKGLIPLREQVYDWLFGEGHQRNIRVIAGRVRRCASQEGNALFALLTLGLADERSQMLAEQLQQWQWPDGGWNCDKRPEAQISSFMESLIPLRALSLHAQLTGDAQSKAAAERAAEIFLTRRLYRRRKNGGIIHADFLRLHYPCYWHYDILFGLKVMAETGLLTDDRCRDALDVLETKRLPDGGFPAEGKYYRLSGARKGGYSLVDWGGTSRRRMNPFVTVDALFVLKEAGRLK